MNAILLHPSDVLFFRDARPMEGSLSGHGAAWPLPTVISQAFHAALHRAEIEDVHFHRRGRSNKYTDTRDRKFGSLVTSGPFPVLKTCDGNQQWFFPRPGDALQPKSCLPALAPDTNPGASSLPKPLKYSLGSRVGPSKDKAADWWSSEAWNAYLQDHDLSADQINVHCIKDSRIFDREHTYGIAIDPDTGTVAKSQFYSANYLRLKEDAENTWLMGVLASAPDKGKEGSILTQDLVKTLLSNQSKHILVGGQQRVCSAINTSLEKGRIPLPLGLVDAFQQAEKNQKFLVKWILLTPAVFPKIPKSEKGAPQPGGWLPNWIDSTSGQVLLKSGNTERQEGESREKWRERVKCMNPIEAHLVAASIQKPLTVSGWALHAINENDDSASAPRPAHLAVPAGAVYYFEANGLEQAKALATALNWHGSGDGSKILNRRSTLFGEKGFGLGVCGTWKPHPSNKQ